MAAIPTIEEFLEQKDILLRCLDIISTPIAIIRMELDAKGVPCDWQFAYSNKALAKLEGVEHSRLLGTFFYRDIFPQGDRKWLDFYGKVALTGQAARRRDLSPEVNKYLEIQAYQPCYGYCFCILVDISDSVFQEQKLYDYRFGMISLMKKELAAFCFYDIDQHTLYNDFEELSFDERHNKIPSTLENIPQSLADLNIIREDDVLCMHKKLIQPLENNIPKVSMNILLNLSSGEAIDEWKWYNVSFSRYSSILFNTRRAACSIRDIHEQVEMQNKLRRKADKDSLTSVYNRSAAMEYITERLQKNDTFFIFYLFDFDNFKTVNDTYGHAYGDNVLIFFAQELKKVLKDHIIFRLGGDEFAAFGQGYLHDEVESFCLKIFCALHKQNSFSFATKCSIGIALSRGACSYGELYQAADEALYQAKREGKNTWRIKELPSVFEDDIGMS